MVDVKFKAVPEFNKELKKLSKKYKLLDEDFKKFLVVLTKNCPIARQGLSKYLALEQMSKHQFIK